MLYLPLLDRTYVTRLLDEQEAAVSEVRIILETIQRHHLKAARRRSVLPRWVADAPDPVWRAWLERNV